MIHVLATIQTTASDRDKLIAAFEKLRPQVLAEPGCFEYVTAIDLATPLDAQSPLRDDVVMMIEKWESLKHLEDHLAAPHMDAFREANSGIIKGLTLQVLSPA
jgi:quinol monooxygenase YgiN